MPCTTIVGVVTNTHRQDLVEGLVPQLYRPLDQLPASITDRIVSFFGYTMVARTRGDAATMAEPLRRAMQSVSGRVPYATVTTMRAMLGRQTRGWELGARVFTAFGALALVLAAVGLFSVVAFTIGQRMHEFGVRSALGAQAADLLRLTSFAASRRRWLGSWWCSPRARERAIRRRDAVRDVAARSGRARRRERGAARRGDRGQPGAGAASDRGRSDDCTAGRVSTQI